MEELNFGVHNGHPSEILFEEEEECEQSLASDHNGTVFKKLNEAGEEAIAYRNWLLFICKDLSHGCGTAILLVQTEKYLIDLREGILGKGLVKHGDEGLLHARLTL